MNTSQRFRSPLGYAGTIGAVALVTLFMWVARAHLTSATIALVYLLAVYMSALRWGIGPAAAGSVLAFLAFDYLFIPPILSFSVASPSEALPLIVFLIVTIITSRLATRAAAEAREARLHARESQALFGLSEAVAEARSADGALTAIAEHAANVFGVRSCAILLPDGLGALRVQMSFPAQEPPDLTREEDGIAAYAWGHLTLMSHGAALFVPIRSGTQREGVLRLEPHSGGYPLPAAEQRLIETFATAAAVAIERWRLQKAATRAEILRRSDELKSALLDSVSHDLRTPLATIKAGITALLEDSMIWDPPAQREILSAANEEVDRLTRLISNLLDLSRIEAGALKPNRQWYEMAELIRDAVRRMASLSSDHSITVMVPDGIPPVFVDYVQMQEVVTNLVTNAAAYSPAGTDIHVTVDVEGTWLVVRVRDRGPGIPAAEAERIFSKFYRIGQRRGGTGLGLTICRGLVEAHGGRILVENPGQPGAIFAVALPLLTPPVLAATPL